jgi:putative transposase
MARLSRLVIPGYPDHVTQRGVHSLSIFSVEDDRYAYLNFMAEESECFGSCVLDEPHLLAAALC